MIEKDNPAASPRTTAWLTGVLLLAVGWVYWPTIEQMARRWSEDPQYTHGYVVPLFAIIVLWLRRDSFPRALRPAWWGILLVLAGGLMRLAGALCAFQWLEAGAMLPCLAGLIVLSSGPAVLRWSWPAGVFLLFILPWPFQFDVLLTYPLRHIATVISTYALQTLGVPAFARGNIIVVNKLEVGVVEACSGLGMLMTSFFALSTAVAFVIQRPLRSRIILFLSAAPIGVLMNVVRITVTVFLYQAAGPKMARLVFHDVAGWVMMPMALVVLWLELLFLGRLWLPAEPTGPTPTDPMPGARSPALRPAGSPAPEMKSRPAEADRSLQEIPDVAY